MKLVFRAGSPPMLGSDRGASYSPTTQKRFLLSSAPWPMLEKVQETGILQFEVVDILSQEPTTLQMVLQLISRR